MFVPDHSASPPFISFDPNEAVEVEAEFVKVVCYKDLFGWKREAFVNFVSLAYRNPEIAKKKKTARKRWKHG